MPFRPNEITKEHILKAVAKIESENIPLIRSTRYDVFINGKPYPPKEIMRYAHEQLDGEKRWEYSGGPQTFRFLERMGFEVKKKVDAADPVLDLIERYKTHIKENKLNDELYKWQLLAKFRGRPNLDAPNFGEDIGSIDYSNLIFHTPGRVIRFIAEHRPELYRKAFRALFDEQLPLFERMSQFQTDVLAAYREVESNFPTKHDERTIAALLTYHDPEKYTFYKDSYYKKFCDLIGIAGKPAGQKYVHYLELIDNLIEDYLEDDGELLAMVNSFLLADCFSDPNHKILAQDILYQMLDKSVETNYWVFQANPKVYDLEEGLNSGLVDNWTVSAHKDKIKIGDKIILWSTGNRSGCYALAEVTEEPQEIDASADDYLWKVEDKNSFKAGIKVTHNLMSAPILQDRIKSTPGLNNLKVGTQGTNFSATKQQYEIILGLIEHPTGPRNEGATTQMHSSLAKNTILYGPPGTGKTYNSIDKAVEIIDGPLNRSHADNKKRFDELRQQGQIEFVTFHQNYSYEDFVVGIRPDVESDHLRFQPQKGIFYRMARGARDNYEASLSGSSSKRSFDEVFTELVEDPIARGESVTIPMASGLYLTITELSETSIHFDKPIGPSKHTLSISTLQDIVDQTRVAPRGLSAYYNPLAKLISEKRKIDSPAATRKKFVLIIDEINRANISKVFGELITLLEEDKRLGEENELRVTLPNGEKEFGVPPNLFVIGTMNTADKSIALIDIALRRRFDFIGNYPRYDVLSDQAAELLRTVNSRIFEKKKSADYLIGHAYFMSGAPIDAILKNKVIPLLTEYFAGKTDIVSDIFAGTTWSVDYNTNSFEWDISEK